VKHYSFRDGVFTFWIALYPGYGIVFRVRDDSVPAVRAIQKGIVGWDKVVPAYEEQVQKWVQTHKDYPIFDVTEKETE
jgi:hypothetical protein